MKYTRNILKHCFKYNSLMLALVAGLIPNALFLATMPLYIAERSLAPFFFVFAAFVMIMLPRKLAIFGWLAFFAAAICDVTLIVMMAFHLPFKTAFTSLQTVAAIDVTQSMLYMAFATVVALTTVTAAFLTHKNREHFRAASPIPLTVIAFALHFTNTQVNLPYFQVEGVSPDFESTTDQTGLNAQNIILDGKNVLVVMVEGLGAFANPAERELFENALTAGLPTNRYRFESGTTSYSGSTTAAATRELCGFWGDYTNFLENKSYDCIPKRLKDSGIATHGWHAFSHDMFWRDVWWPRIGFESLHFEEDILKSNAPNTNERCGTVFEGLCDLTVADLLHKNLISGKAGQRFDYWLTLNTHIPYVAKNNGNLTCHTSAARIDNKMVCELSELWLEIFDKVNEIASDPNLPATDILVVGDHHTPMWERDAKGHFTLNKVDWYLLRNIEKAPMIAALH